MKKALRRILLNTATRRVSSGKAGGLALILSAIAQILAQLLGQEGIDLEAGVIEQVLLEILQLIFGAGLLAERVSRDVD